MYLHEEGGHCEAFELLGGSVVALHPELGEYGNQTIPEMSELTGIPSQ
jgi:hypothetical protein